ncbi:MAG: ribose 5-phosphate isomerase B [Candidatus Omnitrophota bacterium]
MKVLIGSDHGGFKLKNELVNFLKQKKIIVEDLGTHSEDSCDYPIVAFNVAKKVSKDKNSKGILICKSGIGNSIVANKVKGIRAALCYNLLSAKLSRQHNDANILVLGARFTKKELAKKIALTWLKTDFEGGRHLRRVNQIKKIEGKGIC